MKFFKLFITSYLLSFDYAFVVKIYNMHSSQNVAGILKKNEGIYLESNLDKCKAWSTPVLFLFESLWEEGLESQKRKKPLIFSLLCRILSSGFGLDRLWDRSQTSPQTSLSSPGE